MKALVFGYMKMAGKSKKTGLAYSMARLYVASELGSKRTDDYDRTAGGYEAVEVDLADEAVSQFMGIKFPTVLHLQTEMRVMGGKMVPTVVGLAEKAAD